ncbi:hypothetical protein HDU91_001182 [Kappamyces sp. JEL0680]|nr:hypothetical protein HDU91_001182 [Kappamyces sp. JEL0680]
MANKTREFEDIELPFIDNYILDAEHDWKRDVGGQAVHEQADGNDRSARYDRSNTQGISSGFDISNQQYNRAASPSRQLANARRESSPSGYDTRLQEDQELLLDTRVSTQSLGQEDEDLLSPSQMPELDFLTALLLDEELDLNGIKARLRYRMDALESNNHARRLHEMPFYLIAINRYLAPDSLSRSPAILLTLALEVSVSAVIASHQTLIGKNLLITAFLPLLSAIAGNIGLQSSTATLRALATGHASTATYAAIWRVFRRELLSSAIIALWGSCFIAIISFSWSASANFGLVTGLAIFLNATLAGLLGAMGPLLFKKLGWDPALLAGPFETALQDVIGTGLYLTLSYWFLR